MIPLPISCDRISIKLQLTGKSCLIFQFYHMIGRLVSHETLKFNMTRKIDAEKGNKHGQQHRAGNKTQPGL